VNATGALAIIWRTLTPAQRRRLVILQIVSLVMAISTVLGLAAVMTFLAVLSTPAFVENHAVLSWMWRVLDTTRPNFLWVLGGVFIALLVASAVTNVLGSRAMGRFAYSVGDRIREVLFAEYLRRDYLFHVRAGAGWLMDTVLNQSDRVTLTLLFGQVLITNAVLTLLVVVSIAIVNLPVAIGGVLAVAGSYFIFYLIVQRRIARNGRVQSQFSAERTATVEQALLGIKYALVAGAQPAFSTRLTAVTRTLSHSMADTQFIAQFPKYVLECVAGAALIACAAYVSGRSTDGAWLAQLSFIGFAGFRLLPAVQQMYNAFVIVRANRVVIDNLASELARSQADDRRARVARRSADRWALARSIELVDVSFRYSPETPLVLDNLALRIEAGTAVGIVGASGCGKTTLIDLILGLLSPAGGRIEVDGESLDSSRLASWQQAIGYVPQDVMILDAPLRENIAFGVEPGGIDDARVREVARQAGASEFIEALAGGYSANLNDTGLSGGQRQRIGIARALYHDPALLVLDEATNALDGDTERAIIETVVRNRGSRTLLIVAHGAALIDACDRVYEMKGGILRDNFPPRRGDAPLSYAARAD
jgi:ATP-binding cassette, subfamily B, bacterial PglK